MMMKPIKYEEEEEEESLDDDQLEEEVMESNSSSSLEDLLMKSARSLQLNLSRASIDQFEDYLSHLSSSTLSVLIDEPNRLRSISCSLESDLSLVCLRDFKSFLISHQASISIKNSFERFDHAIDRFIDRTDSLRSKVIEFDSTVQPILDDRNQINTLLDHLNAFENLLELPQLISTCINHRLSNQAIDLALKLRSLDSSILSYDHHPITPHASNPIIIHRIRNQVDRSLQSLTHQSLNRLSHKDLKLSSAIRTIVTLRRLSSIFSQSDHHQANHPIQPISEPELRMAFLISRWQALSETLHELELSSSISSSSSSILDLQAPPQDLLNQSSLTQLDEDRLKFLRRWLEIWREIVGDTLSIYLDIFLDPTSNIIIPSSLPNPPHQPSQPHHSLPQFLDDPQTPLNFFLTQAVDLPRLTLNHHLDYLVSVSSLNSLLTQLAYCGGAFGKWGLDFTRTLCPLIIDRLERLVNLRIHLGLRQFSLDLKPIIAYLPSSTKTKNFQTRRRSINPFLSINHSSASLGGLENALISTDSLKRVLNLKPVELDPGSGSGSEKLNISWLNLFPPLARLVNSQLSALNELRLLPAAGSYQRISDGQFECFKSVTEELRKIVLVLPETRLDAGSFLGAGSENETLNSEDPEKRSEYQYRLVIYRFILLWSRNILPFLERALRVGIYADLGLTSIDPRFLDLCTQTESLLRQIIPSAGDVNDRPQPSEPPQSSMMAEEGGSVEPPDPIVEEAETEKEADDENAEEPVAESG